MQLPSNLDDYLLNCLPADPRASNREMAISKRLMFYCVVFVLLECYLPHQQYFTHQVIFRSMFSGIETTSCVSNPATYLTLSTELRSLEYTFEADQTLETSYSQSLFFDFLTYFRLWSLDLLILTRDF